MSDVSPMQETQSSAQSCIVSSFEVDGFWRTSRIKCEFDARVNFLIGPNGSGKTTIVNLLAAALTADFRILDRVEFTKLTVELVGVESGRLQHRIHVFKEDAKDLPFAPIRYEVFNAISGAKAEFSLDEVEEQFSLRDPRYHSRRRAAMRSKVLSEMLGNVVDVTWLSVNRHEAYPGERQDPGFESLVDLKIDSQANQLVRFFSKLEQKSAEVLKTFQQSVFLSLLLGHETTFNIWEEMELDVDQERKRLVPILEQFGVQRSRFNAKVERHLRMASEAAQKVSEDKGLSNADVVALVNQKRIYEVVGEWETYLSKKNQIFRLRDAFIRILNSLLLGKQVYISATNELAFRAVNRGSIPVKSLSSGEKQLMIILGQALLQDSRPAIYIADEPELSLHVAWQEQIVENIREINPLAQIIFATHSPDIVGSYQDRVLNTRELFRA